MQVSTTRYILGSILFLAAVAFQFWLIKIFGEIIGDVNRILAQDDQIPKLGPSWLRGRVI
jgi:hypothetical protein